MSDGLTLMQGIILDMVAEGKSPRQIAEATGYTPAEAAKMAYDLLDKEIITDPDQRRKLQVYRLEKLTEALWQRTINHAERDDMKNMILLLEKTNELLGLNQAYDAEMQQKMFDYQKFAYMQALQALLVAFKALAPGLMQDEEWLVWFAEQLEVAEKNMELEQ